MITWRRRGQRVIHRSLFQYNIIHDLLDFGADVGPDTADAVIDRLHHPLRHIGVISAFKQPSGSSRVIINERYC